jgi:hypothetical protein
MAGARWFGATASAVFAPSNNFGLTASAGCWHIVQRLAHNEWRVRWMLDWQRLSAET